jgi:hypothetical protein
VRREKFDENVIKSIIADEAYAFQDRKTVSAYYKQKYGAGEKNVVYQFGQGCEEYKLGRLFAQSGLGIANWSWTIRNPLAEKWYWDIDIANAHYRIALKFCEQYGLDHERLRHYCDNRNEVLKMVCPESRDRAKNEFLKTLYGDKARDYGFYLKDVEGIITQEGHKYVNSLKGEIALLMKTIWEKHPQYHDLKTGEDKNKKPIKKRDNPQASLMALVFQTEERRMLMCLSEYLSANKRYMAVYIHDGGYVEKLETEKEFPKELLEGGAEAIKEFLGYDVTLEQKEITHNWKPKVVNTETYEYKKAVFEEKNALVGTTFVVEHQDGYIEYMNEKSANLKFANWLVNEIDPDTLKMKSIPFLLKYKKDTKRAEYDRIDFQPDPNFDNKRIYNLFDGFAVEKIKDKVLIDESIIEEKIKILKTHLHYLTSGNEDFLLKWLAYIIQHPHIKTEVGILLRDQGNLLNEGGGTGKNQFFERIASKLIGDKYSYFIDDNNDIYNSFNSLFEGKLLVFVDEAGGKENHQNSETLKSKITKKKLNVNKKMVSQYTVNDYSNFIFCSNNANPIPLRKGDRRWAVFDVNPEKRGNKEYFEKLVEALEDDETIQYFYHYLKYKVTTYKNANELSSNIPTTEAYRELKYMNAPSHLKFLLNLIEEGEMKTEYGSREFYETYREWCINNKKGKEGEILTETAFSIIMKKNDAEITLDNKRSSSGVKYIIDIPKIITGLRRLKMMSDDFVYRPKITGPIELDDTEQIENAQTDEDCETPNIETQNPKCIITLKPETETNDYCVKCNKWRSGIAYVCMCDEPVYKKRLTQTKLNFP